ncbi:MAG: lipoprotein 17-related variable surface protein [Malacoplasma sp.]
MRKKISRANKLLAIFLTIGTFSVCASAIAIPSALGKFSSSNVNDLSFNNDNFSVSNTNLDANQFVKQVKPLVPIEFNTYMQSISTKQGPIGFFKNEIRALDWFGALRWTLDTSKLTTPTYTPFIHRAFANWAYSFADDVIWLLMNVAPKSKQKIVSIDAKNGTVLKEIEVPRIVPNDGGLFYFVQVLSSGNIIVYGEGGQFKASKQIFICNPATDTTMRAIVSSMSDTFIDSAPSTDVTNNQPYTEVRLFNIIPVIENRNIMVFQRYHGLVKANLSLALVDDNFNPIYPTLDTNNPWSKMRYIGGDTDLKYWQPFPDKSFYKLLDGRVLTIIYNQLIIFDNLKIENGKDFLTLYTLEEPVQSFSFDTNENLFLTYRGQSNIYKLVLPERNSSAQPISYPYYNLQDSSVNGIKNNASKFVLYNVSGYAGQIMLIKSIERLDPNKTKPFNPTPEDITQNQYGLAAAIVNNVSSPANGDSRGLLNTADAFQFSADFDILQPVLDAKLPSEITQSDLTLLNEAFFTINTTTNTAGELLYPSFVKGDINDEAGTFTIETNLDQVPWFASVLPTNFVPLKVKKTFSTKDKIAARVAWKDVNTDYNFKNTLPTKVDATDLKRFDPFYIDLLSQRIVDNNTQAQLYPKKDYSVASANDTTGIIKIQCLYTYMPLGVATIKANEKTFTTSQDFNIFKSNDPKNFNWLVSTGTNSNNIKSISSLKMLSQSNLLPSSVDGTDTSQFLPFINVNTSSGYPLSKMSFKLRANDATGELAITATLPASYNGTEETFTQTYIGFNKTNDYSFSYKKPSYLTHISGSTAAGNASPKHEYNKMLPTDVTEEMVYLDFVTYSGYNDLDLDIDFNANNNLGELEIIFTLDSSYPSKLGNNVNTFKLENGKYISKIKLGGFLTQENYYKQFSLKFKDNNDKSLSNVKNIEVNVILNSINSANGFTLDGVTYKSLAQLVELFISFKGANIPATKASNISAYANNSNGTLTFELLFLPSETGFTSNLIFSQIFTGFIKGVEKPTSDSFIFKNQDNLEETLLAKLPSQIKNELTTNKLLVKDYFVNFLLGQFTSLITNTSAFNLVIDANDVYGTLSIVIIFEPSLITNKETLTTYSIEYNGFQKVS